MNALVFFNDPATPEIYTLSQHDALPIWPRRAPHDPVEPRLQRRVAEELVEVEVHLHERLLGDVVRDRKSTRLNSSHANISYAVFCLKKKTPQHTLPALRLYGTRDPLLLP